MISIIIPANNEASYIDACICSLLAQKIDLRASGGGEIIVVANGCSDSTADKARALIAQAGRAGWRLEVIETAERGKANALNLGDRAAVGAMRVYLDADVVASESLLAKLASALDRPDAAYASGRLVVPTPKSWWTRHYARMWQRLPFMTGSVPGAGLFAVNAAGRRRWGAFPEIISDDTFARLHFSPEERIAVNASYSWPMVEGLGALVRVRRRQDAGVVEVRAKFPELRANACQATPTAAQLFQLFMATPVSFCVYGFVSVAVRFGKPWRSRNWTRGR